LIEPKQSDIDRYQRSFTALFKANGGNVHAFIKHISESMAYQRGLAQFYRKEVWEMYKERRREGK